MADKKFKISSKYSPAGDQPKAIEALTKGILEGEDTQTLLGITGSGKTFTIANVIQNVQKPTLIIAHNKTLAAQLYNEFKELFPDNAVEYFISYYDYYQPEAYIPRTDTYIEKSASINDLDERTRNFPREAGIDKIDSKLNSLNNMMISGAKTNQVFNQVFEYLAEWVDNASVLINTIADRVESLDEIEQIKAMLTDLKAEAEDDSESIELVEALGNVFEKQTKRISSLEAKLDKIIVENTINSTKKFDLTPLEDTINKFLVAVDEKMSAQQDKINSLEAKLEDALELLDGKDTAQLTKKVGGMDRQIAKLNKSIEKIASHVVEK